MFSVEGDGAQLSSEGSDLGFKKGLFVHRAHPHEESCSPRFSRGLKVRAGPDHCERWHMPIFCYLSSRGLVITHFRSLNASLLEAQRTKSVTTLRAHCAGRWQTDCECRYRVQYIPTFDDVALQPGLMRGSTGSCVIPSPKLNLVIPSTPQRIQYSYDYAVASR